MREHICDLIENETQKSHFFMDALEIAKAERI